MKIVIPKLERLGQKRLPPMLGTNGSNAGAGIAFLVGAGAVAEFVAKACSSPQTVHINANKRAATLMLWVNIGLVESALMVGTAMFFDKKYAKYIFYGGLAEGVVTYAEYMFAKQWGLAESGEPTESY